MVGSSFSLPAGQRRRPFFQRWLAAGAYLLFAAGCTSLLNWDPNGLPCDSTERDGYSYFCQSGYSCETYSLECLRDESVRTGGLCTQSRQCSSGDICPVDYLGGGGVQGRNGVLSCLIPCEQSASPEPYLQPGGCARDTQVCMPYLDVLASNANKALIGGCLPSSSCTAGTGCALDANTNGICVQATAKATACMQGCQITWNADSYSDNCDSRHSCQPVGIAGQQVFACVYNGQTSTTTPLATVAGVTVGQTNATCAPISAPCVDADVCVPEKYTCAVYCPITSNAVSPCPTNQASCCPFLTFDAKPTTGYCAATCD